MAKTKYREGFGLAEVMLASGVLILVVASVVALSRFVIRGYALTASRTQALYLAQEGMERVRNIRDTYWIDGCPETNFSDLVNGSYTTRWNPTPQVSGCGSLAARWELVAGPETIPPGQVGPLEFTRTLTISNAPDLGTQGLTDNTKLVTVTVSWTEGGRVWSVTAETYLSNWKLEA